MNKNLFIREVLEFLLLSLVISAFFFGFLFLSSRSIGEIWLDRQGISLRGEQIGLLHLWIRSLCLLASSLVFLALFLFLLGQRIAYVASIIRGVDQLREKQLDFSIPVEGKDEFAVLAESINYLASSEKQLKQKEEELRQKRENFVRTLSHDIRTPLTSILSNSQYLASKEALTPEETAAYIALVQSKAEQIRLLTDQLLGKAESENRLVENAALLLQQLAFQWEETLEDSFLCQVDLSGCQPFKAEVELSALQRIFDNLASNVEKYADPSQPVVLRLSCGQGEVQIFQQNAVTPNPEKPKDSHGIGLKSINEIAKNTGGYADFSLNPASFEIRILLKLKSCL